jgi:hypothetical protein
MRSQRNRPMESSEPPSTEELKERERLRSVRERELLHAIKTNLGDIDALAAELDCLEEDGVYRYYHQSFKLYELQVAVERAQTLFQRIAPAGPV